MNSNYKTIQVNPVSPALGADIGGIDIARGIDDEQFLELYQAYIDYAFIFLRDQDITPEQHFGPNSYRSGLILIELIVFSGHLSVYHHSEARSAAY